MAAAVFHYVKQLAYVLKKMDKKVKVAIIPGTYENWRREMRYF